jgi:hypothetical protein
VPESSLNTAYYELQADVGFYLGFGRGTRYDETDWTEDQSGRIDSCLKSGLRQFYWPAPVEGHADAWSWSFLRPLASLSLASGSQDMALPDDFGGLEGRITYTSSSAGQTWPIDVVNPGTIRQLYAGTPSMTGRPLSAAIETNKGTGTTSSNRCKLLVFPQAGAAYTLQFTYYVNPEFLTGAFPYAYGGAQHAETLKASCLAAAELYQDDMKGPQWDRFQERMQASIAMDRRLKPQLVGYNADRSDWIWDQQRPNQHGYSPITVGGTQY